MALSKPSAAPAPDRRRVMPAFTATNTGFMPVDAVYEILLRVPAKDVCRFRAVCRPWRSLLSDPQFIAAHASHHPGPLIVAGCHTSDTTNPNHGILCEIMDLSGRVVKRVRSTWDRNEWLVFAQLELICTARGYSKSFRLLNPADGAVYALPEGLSEEHAELDICNYRAGIVFGQVASTGLYKVLRVLGCHFDPEQLFEVLTLDGSIDSGWRGKEAPPVHLEMQSRVVINGIVYFFSNEVLVYPHATLRHIDSFDLETEEWRATLQGPQINRVDDAVDMLNDQAYCPDLSMADLNGTLAVVSCHHSSMDLWFLISFEKNLWVKQHSIKLNLSVQHDEFHYFHIRPLLVLNDGRIVTYIGTRGLLRIYNPMTSTYTDLAEMGPRIGIGLYTGNLLSLANGAS